MIRQEIFDHLSLLKLHGIKNAYDEILTNAKKRNDAIDKIILELLKAEVSEREIKSISYRLKQACLPCIKEIKDFDFSFNEISRSLIEELAEGHFLKNASNVIFIGEPGTGKTHLSISIAMSLIRKKYRVKFYNIVDLTNELETELSNNQSGRLTNRLLKFDCIILDEFGYVPFTKNGGDLLFHLLSKLYENTSVIITTNLIFSDWDKIFRDVKMTSALLDRLSHHCEVIETGMKSWRLHEKMKEQNLIHD